VAERVIRDKDGTSFVTARLAVTAAGGHEIVGLPVHAESAAVELADHKGPLVATL
jgi:hypothetical protein